jgi:hypothetical protein
MNELAQHRARVVNKRRGTGVNAQLSAMTQ